MPNHDRGYKRLFAQPRMVEDLLKGFLHQPWVEELDFSTLERVSGSYVSDDLREREDDMVWRARWGPLPLYIYLVLEFQSRPDPFMALRLWVYVGLLLQDLVRRGEFAPERRLPPVLPLVLYNGRQRWSAPLEVSDLIVEVPGLEPYQPRFSYLLIDELRAGEAELVPRNLASALFRLERSRGPEDIQRVVATLAEWLDEPGSGPLRRAFLTWLREVLLPARVPGAEVPEVDDLEEFQAMLEETVIDWTRDWKQQGLEEGRREGLELGRAEGREMGRAEGRAEGQEVGRREGEMLILRRQLESKFGSLEASVEARLAAAGPEELLEWSDRLLTAESVDQVFR